MALNSSGRETENAGVYFGVPDAPCLVTTPVETARFSVARIDRRIAGGEVVRIDLPPADAYFLMLYLDDALHNDVFADGSSSPLRRYERGSICLVDLRGGASIALHDDLHALAFLLPQALFDEIADRSSSIRRRRLRCRRGERDTVISNLGIALVAMFDVPLQSALLQHMAMALCAHLMQDYSDIALRNGMFESALSLWQEKAAKEFMLKNLADDLPLAAIAETTGLSPGHFAQEFKKATGTTPHQWLTSQRVERAKELLLRNDLSLKTVSDRCGFTDQSHFTKVFSRLTGMTPAVWRRAVFH